VAHNDLVERAKIKLKKFTTSEAFLSSSFKELMNKTRAKTGMMYIIDVQKPSHRYCHLVQPSSLCRVSATNGQTYSNFRTMP